MVVAVSSSTVLFVGGGGGVGIGVTVAVVGECIGCEHAPTTVSASTAHK